MFLTADKCIQPAYILNWIAPQYINTFNSQFQWYKSDDGILFLPFCLFAGWPFFMNRWPQWTTQIDSVYYVFIIQGIGSGWWRGKSRDVNHAVNVLLYHPDVIVLIWPGKIGSWSMGLHEFDPAITKSRRIVLYNPYPWMIVIATTDKISHLHFWQNGFWIFGIVMKSSSN